MGGWVGGWLVGWEAQADEAGGGGGGDAAERLKQQSQQRATLPAASKPWLLSRTPHPGACTPVPRSRRCARCRPSFPRGPPVHGSGSGDADAGFRQLPTARRLSCRARCHPAMQQQLPPSHAATGACPTPLHPPRAFHTHLVQRAGKHVHRVPLRHQLRRDGVVELLGLAVVGGGVLGQVLVGAAGKGKGACGGVGRASGKGLALQRNSSPCGGGACTLGQALARAARGA